MVHFIGSPDNDDLLAKEEEEDWVALVSGLDLGSSDIPLDEDDSTDVRLQLFVEYIKAESGGPSEQAASRRCSALVILGNSLDVPRRSQDDLKSSVIPVRWGHRIYFRLMVDSF